MSGPLPIDFDPSSLILLNVIMACMMFGVSLSLRFEDFTRVARAPVTPVAAMVAQFILLPFLTWLMTMWLPVQPELALGMMLVASCPGGTFSNVLTWIARGNVAASVSMSAISSLAATVMTPFNFALYGHLNPHTRELLSTIALDPINILLLVALVLALPLILGMWVGRRFPGFAARSERPFRIAAMLMLLGFVGLAFSKNFDLFIERFHSFFWLVVLHNLMALALGYAMARALRVRWDDRRAMTLEIGIQNSGLGLVILFTFFPQAGGMMLITAFWGVWHLVSGMVLAMLWSRSGPATT